MKRKVALYFLTLFLFGFLFRTGIKAQTIAYRQANLASNVSIVANSEAPAGKLTDGDGKDITEVGLHGLAFRADGFADPNTLFFTSEFSSERDGLLQTVVARNSQSWP